VVRRCDKTYTEDIILLYFEHIHIKEVDISYFSLYSLPWIPLKKHS
jgi:hypothetical protein